jgi:hypothetical protein
MEEAMPARCGGAPLMIAVEAVTMTMPRPAPARTRPAALKTGTPGSAAIVEGHLVAVRVGEREGAAERPVDGR